MIADTKQLTKSINHALAELNSKISENNLKAKAFFTDYDEEFEGSVAHVIFVVDGTTVEANLEKLDEYCTMANENLAKFVVFANCIYRTASEYQSDFKNAEWENVIQEVTDGQN